MVLRVDEIIDQSHAKVKEGGCTSYPEGWWDRFLHGELDLI